MTAIELSHIGMNATGFNPWRCCNVYKTFVRPTMEYGLACAYLEPRHIQELEKAQNKALRTVLAAPRTCSTESLHRLAEVETMEVRVQILQAKWLFRILTSPEDSMARRWLGDACQDSTSPLRKIMKYNRLFRENFCWEVGTGPSIPVLWIEEERRAMENGSIEGRPFKSGHEGEWSDEIGYVTDQSIERLKKENRELQLQTATRKNTKNLVRDLPPGSDTKSPLRQMKCAIPDRRRLIGWWIGMFPSHRQQRCGVCHEMLPRYGVRKHCANCVLWTDAKGLVLRPDELRGDNSMAAYANRASNDPITLSIWRCHEMNAWQSGQACFDVVLNALQIVSDRVLCRTNDGRVHSQG